MKLLRRIIQNLTAHLDMPLFLIVMALMTIGLATIYSAEELARFRLFSCRFL